jgi:hypothetical protein
VTESEDMARRRLHQLVDTELPVGGSATADRVVARYRRRRRARAARLGVAAAVILAASVPVALAATRSEPTAQTRGVAVRSIASHSASPTIMANPARPELGVAYRFDLYSHCGIRWARFGGREWTALHPGADPARLPDSTGTTRYTGYVAGTMRLVGPDLLRFTLTDPYAAGRGQSFDFVPARDPLPLCE